MRLTPPPLHCQIAKIIGIDPLLVHNNTSRETVPAWDSFATFLVASELEATYGVRFTTEEIRSCTSVRAIKDILRVHGITDET